MALKKITLTLFLTLNSYFISTTHNHEVKIESFHNCIELINEILKRED
jgi:hypothetical protein